MKYTITYLNVTLEDIKINLQETDYGPSISNETYITPPLVEKLALDKLVTEFFFLRSQAVEPLATFFGLYDV